MHGRWYPLLAWVFDGRLALPGLKTLEVSMVVSFGSVLVRDRVSKAVRGFKQSFKAVLYHVDMCVRHTLVQTRGVLSYCTTQKNSPI